MVLKNIIGCMSYTVSTDASVVSTVGRLMFCIYNYDTKNISVWKSFIIKFNSIKFNFNVKKSITIIFIST